jgi:hypothetical protein
MNFQFFNSIRPKPTNHYPIVMGQGSGRPDWKDKQLAEKLHISAEEVVRRDLVVKHKWMEFRGVRGQVVEAANANQRKQYGKLTIIGCVKSVFDIENDKWPKDDNPLTVSAISEKEGNIIAATDFFKFPVGADRGSSC